MFPISIFQFSRNLSIHCRSSIYKLPECWVAHFNLRCFCLLSIQQPPVQIRVNLIMCICLCMCCVYCGCSFLLNVCFMYVNNWLLVIYKLLSVTVCKVFGPVYYKINFICWYHSIVSWYSDINSILNT